MVMESAPQLPELTEGSVLPGITRVVKQENINLYARASRDFNPIHIDEDFARKTPLGGTVAHGILILAYVSQMMTAAFGQKWLNGGKLNVRFRAPARPGDTITVSGKIRRIEKNEGHSLISCEVLCGNQDGESVITGEARVMIEEQ